MSHIGNAQRIGRILWWVAFLATVGIVMWLVWLVARAWGQS
jgi:hypothetical protein